MGLKSLLILLTLLLASGFTLAQTTPDVVYMKGGVQAHMGDVVFKADEGERNTTSEELILRGNVVLRQGRRPAVQPMAATNFAGAAFPDVSPVTFRVRGPVLIEIGALRVIADTADVNGLTGEMTLGGDVRIRREK